MPQLAAGGRYSRYNRLQQSERELAQRGDRSQSRARRLRSGVDEARSGFDARDYARDVARSTFADFREDLGRGVEELRGSQVGRGRIKTGYGFEDEDRLVEDFQDRLSRDIASQAFTAAGLNLRNLEGRSRESSEATRRSDDILVGVLDREQAKKNAREREKRNRLDLLLGGVGAGAGFLLGGPGGAALGGRLGSAAAGAI